MGTALSYGVLSFTEVNVAEAVVPFDGQRRRVQARDVKNVWAIQHLLEEQDPVEIYGPDSRGVVRMQAENPAKGGYVTIYCLPDSELDWSDERVLEELDSDRSDCVCAKMFCKGHRVPTLDEAPQQAAKFEEEYRGMFENIEKRARANGRMRPEETLHEYFKREALEFRRLERLRKQDEPLHKRDCSALERECLGEEKRLKGLEGQVVRTY